MLQIRNVYNILVGKHEGNSQMETRGVDVEIILERALEKKWKDVD
jgi:hypothetical protein